MWASVHTYTHVASYFALKQAERGSSSSLPPLSAVRPLARQMSINRLQLLFWLIVLDADVWKQTQRWKLKLVFEMTRAYKWTETALVACVCLFKGHPLHQCQTPRLDPSDPPQTCWRLRGEGEEGEGVPRGHYSLVTAKRLPLPEGRHGNAIWFLQQCQSTTPPSSSSSSELHTHTQIYTHSYKRGLSDWMITLGIATKWWP